MQAHDISIDRRTLLTGAMLLVGAAAVPFDELFAAEKTAARFLAAPRFALLSAVADTIVPRTDTPGAVDAGVPGVFDALLRDWASPERRISLVEALDKIDARARQQHREAFAALPAATRFDLLSAYDAEALKPPAAPSSAAPRLNPPPTVADPNYGRTRQSPPQGKAQQVGESAAVLSGPPVADPGYSKLKELIVTLYYLSEPALTKELVYEHAPGHWQPSVPVTPETRQVGGVGAT